MQVTLDNAHSENISLSRTSPSVFPIDTTGYTEIVNILSGPTVATPDAVSLEVDPEKQEMTLRSQSWVLEVFPASEFFTTLAKKSAEVAALSLTPEELTVSLSGKIYDIKVIISTINIENVNYTGEKSAFPSGYVSGYALIRKK